MIMSRLHLVAATGSLKKRETNSLPIRPGALPRSRTNMLSELHFIFILRCSVQVKGHNEKAYFHVLTTLLSNGTKHIEMKVFNLIILYSVVL